MGLRMVQVHWIEVKWRQFYCFCSCCWFFFRYSICWKCNDFLNRPPYERTHVYKYIFFDAWGPILNLHWLLHAFFQNSVLYRRFHFECSDDLKVWLLICPKKIYTKFKFWVTMWAVPKPPINKKLDQTKNKLFIYLVTENRSKVFRGRPSARFAYVTRWAVAEKWTNEISADFHTIVVDCYFRNHI